MYPPQSCAKATLYNDKSSNTTSSVYTSWTLDIEKAREFALSGSNKGIVLKATFDIEVIVQSPNTADEKEKEVLIVGLIREFKIIEEIEE